MPLTKDGATTLSEIDIDTKDLTELVSERTLNSKVYEKQDKSRRLAISVSPIHYESNGKLEEINTTCVEDIENKKLVVSANIYKSEVKTDFDADDSIFLEYKSEWLKFKPTGAGWNDGTNKEYLTTNKVTATFDKNVITFNDVFKDNLKIQYFITPTGFKKYIIIDKFADMPDLGIVSGSTKDIYFELTFSYTKSANLKVYVDGSDKEWSGKPIVCKHVCFKNNDDIYFTWISPGCYDSGRDEHFKHTCADFYLTDSSITIKLPKVWLDSATFPVYMDPTTTIQPDATAGKDASLIKPNNNNYGSSTVLYIRQANTGDADWKNCDSLVQFDLSSLVGTTINSATFYFYLFAAGWTDRGTFNISRILSGNANWVEGTQDGTSETGSVCWNYFAYSGSTPTNWAGAAGCSTSGTDYSSTVMGTNVMGNQNWAEGQEVAVTISSLTEFSTMVSTNYGILCYSTSSSGDRFCSSDHGTAAYRPKLIVDYTPAYTPRHGVVCHGSTAIV